MKSFFSLKSISLLAMVSLSSEVEAASLSLNPIADTTLSESDVNNNLGGHGFVMSGRALGAGASGRRRALVKFDLSGIPAGSTINSASLTLQIPLGRGGSADFDVHRLTAEWGEGTKGNPSPFGGGFRGNLGSTATTGEATWNSRKHGESAWTNPGAEGDYVEPASATASINSGAPVVWSGTGLAADIAFWAANPGQNFGWIMIAATETPGVAKRLGSREGGNGAALVVDFTPPAPGPAMLAAPQVVNTSDFKFTINTTAGVENVVETSMNLIDWTPFFTNTPASGSFSFTNTNALALPRRFYRVANPPADD